MLATWLVEIYLSKINQLEDIAAAEAASQDVENLRLEQEMLEDELRQFLFTYKVSLRWSPMHEGSRHSYLCFCTAGEPRPQDCLWPYRSTWAYRHTASLRLCDW